MKFEDLKSFRFEENGIMDCVILSFGPYNGIDEIHAVDLKLYKSIPENIGRHDGHLVSLDDDSAGQFFSYGNHAEELFNVMKPLLEEFDFLKDAAVHLRFTENNKTIRNLEFKLNAS